MLVDLDRVIVPVGTTAEEWTEKYGVEPFTAECYKCGQPQTTTIPFAFEQLRGLMAPKCECGHPYSPYCVVGDPRFGDIFAWLQKKSEEDSKRRPKGSPTCVVQDYEIRVEDEGSCDRVWVRALDEEYESEVDSTPGQVIMALIEELATVQRNFTGDSRA